jgi:thiamine-phosphate pyrophosphorylase
VSAPVCRLYLVTPPKFEPAAFREVLAAALDAGDIGCVRVVLNTASEDAVRAACAALLPVTREHDVAVVLDGNPALAARLDCDGVQIGAGDDYGAARAALGRDRIVGVSCGSSRHDAIEAAEADADYVALDADAELLQWWNELMTAPCVAQGDITLDNCAPLIAAGVDFLTVGEAVWNHPDGPAAAVRAFNAAIAEHAPPREGG